MVGGAMKTTQDTYQCECGQITGVVCEWHGPINEMTVVEWMPDHLRSSHMAADNRGNYPHNGAWRLTVESSCADWIVESDPEWSKIIKNHR